MALEASLIAGVRRAARDLVREFGFMHRTLANTDLGPSAVHAILEIGRAGRMTATDLGARLLLDKSTVSRLTTTLVRKGLVAEQADPADRRAKNLNLTPAGADTLALIDRYAERQVVEALAPLPPDQRETVRAGLETYAAALAVRRGGRPATAHETSITEGYRPGLLGEIAALHGAYYARRLGFGAVFEGRVASGLGEFAERLQNPVNGLWSVQMEGRTVASIAIDGEDLGSNRAHLRWFIVADGLRGAGLGRKLLGRALDFCDSRGFAECRLWTVPGLEASRRLYDQHGFTLAEEFQGDHWGAAMTEQIFFRPHGGGATAPA